MRTVACRSILSASERQVHRHSLPNPTSTSTTLCLSVCLSLPCFAGLRKASKQPSNGLLLLPLLIAHDDVGLWCRCSRFLARSCLLLTCNRIEDRERATEQQMLQDYSSRSWSQNWDRDLLPPPLDGALTLALALALILLFQLCSSLSFSSSRFSISQPMLCVHRNFFLHFKLLQLAPQSADSSLYSTFNLKLRNNLHRLQAPKLGETSRQLPTSNFQPQSQSQSQSQPDANLRHLQASSCPLATLSLAFLFLSFSLKSACEPVRGSCILLANLDRDGKSRKRAAKSDRMRW